MFQQDSIECSKSELEMQAVPPTMTTMIQTKMEMYHPIASLDSYHSLYLLRPNITRTCHNQIFT